MPGSRWKTPPGPELDESGEPIVREHPTVGKVYKADDGSGWWSIEAMPNAS